MISNFGSDKYRDKINRESQFPASPMNMGQKYCNSTLRILFYEVHFQENGRNNFCKAKLLASSRLRVTSVTPFYHRSDKKNSAKVLDRKKKTETK